jgi:Trk K+ transport system NAD-binding subunit
VKFLTPQLTYLLTQRDTRENLRALSKYLIFLAATVTVYSVFFHVLMLREGQEHSWLTGLYWTLTVMSTLGFGDITFHSDVGRLFSILVLLSGIVLLLIVLPFAFIRFFYAPWLEAQLRMRAPREVPKDERDHVIMCGNDVISRGAARRLAQRGIQSYVIEPDPATAAELHADGVPVIAGDLDNRKTYERVRAQHARLIFANQSDALNTNITITVREVAPDVPLAALADDKDAVDVLELAGATNVLALKHRLGESLASRAGVGAAHAEVVGRFKDLLIAEFPVQHTGLAGRALRETRLRELTGLSIVAYWEGGVLQAATPESVISEHGVAVVVGTENQMLELDALFVIYEPNENPVLVIGGGKVGRACIRALKKSGARVSVIEQSDQLRDVLAPLADQVVIGNAVDIEVMTKGGVQTAPSIVLTTNDDATNIFLSVYGRRLNPDARIISRVSHERNLEAIHRAGADSVLSYATLGTQSIMGLALGDEISFLGEGVELYVEPVPESLAGSRLGESGIGARTGLNVITLQDGDVVTTNPAASTVLPRGGTLVFLGSPEQREQFRREFS